MKPMTEREFQRQVVELAQLLGWFWWHHHYSVGTAPGVPDLHLLRERQIVAELKTETGRVSAHQEAMLARYREAGVETYTWRPSDWNTIVDTLTRRTS